MGLMSIKKQDVPRLQKLLDDVEASGGPADETKQKIVAMLRSMITVGQDDTLTPSTAEEIMRVLGSDK